jgi:signal peptidase
VRPVIRRAGGVILLLSLVGVWAVFLRPASLGGSVTYLVIRGNSMEPTYHSGDLVVVKAAEAYSIGEIVAYRVPAGEIGAGHLVIHRIIGGDGQVGFLLRGDNNPSVDPWMPRAGDVAGASWAVLPGVGRLLSTIHQPAVAGALAVAALAIGASLRWPGRKKPFVPPRSVPTSP